MSVRQASPSTWQEAWKWARTAGLPTTTAFTIMAWFYIGTSVITDSMDFFLWQSVTGDPFNSNCSYWWLGGLTGLPGAHTQTLDMETYDGVSADDGLSSPLQPEAWYHLAMVKNGTSFTIYLSTENNSSDCIAAATLTSTKTFALAQFGLMAVRENAVVNVKVWTEALTPTLIRPERDSFAVSHLANLYSQSRFNIPGDYTDISGNGHDWTISKRYASENPLALQPFRNPSVLGPLNNTFATAQDLGSTLPVTITARADLGGVTQTLYYKYTAQQPLDKVLGSFAFGDLVTYKPVTTVYVGDAVNHRVYLDPTNSPLTTTNLPMQFPVSELATYFFEMVPNSGNPSPASLSFTLQRAPDAQQIQPSQILIMDDQYRFPACVIDPPTGTVLKYILGFATGEVGCSFADGTIAALDAGFTGPVVLKWYDANLNVFLTVNGPLSGNNPKAGGCDMAGLIYISSANNPVNIFSKSGARQQITLPGMIGAEFCNGLAPNRANTILYWSTRTVGTAIRRFDLVNKVALADLPNSAIAGQSVSDTCILVMSDGSISAVYEDTVNPGKSIYLRHFTTAGTLLATYTYLVSVNVTFIRMGLPFKDDAGSVWVTHRDIAGPTGYMNHKNVKLSDGSFLNNTPYTVPIFEVGIWEGSPTATPPSFGRSESCPILILNPGPLPPAPCAGV